MFYFAFKSLLAGAYSSTVTKEKKTAAWNDILEAIHLESPDTKRKTIEELKKKWSNFTSAAKKEITAYKKSLTGTGKTLEHHSLSMK